MFIHSPFQIIGHSNIQRPIPLTCQNDKPYIFMSTYLLPLRQRGRLKVAIEGSLIYPARRNEHKGLNKLEFERICLLLFSLFSPCSWR